MESKLFLVGAEIVRSTYDSSANGNHANDDAFVERQYNTGVSVYGRCDGHRLFLYFQAGYGMLFDKLAYVVLLASTIPDANAALFVKPDSQRRAHNRKL